MQMRDSAYLAGLCAADWLNSPSVRDETAQVTARCHEALRIRVAEYQGEALRI